MKPLLLKGHERALTKIKLNREGDLLFSCAKDKAPCVWYTENGERLGTYKGHNGAVWCADVSWDSTNLVTGSGDFNAILWDTETGQPKEELKMPSPVRSVGFSYSGNVFFLGTQSQKMTTGLICVFDMRDPGQVSENQPQLKIPITSSPFAGLWSHLDDTITIGDEKGDLSQFDIRGTSLDPVNFDNKSVRYEIRDLQISNDETMLLCSSKDKTAKLFDAHNLTHLKTYKSEKPVNSASISPIRDHIVLGGGEEAMQVTQTATSQAGFEAKFYHLIFEDEFARLKGHFGPINTVAFHPDGKTFFSGGEDGYVRIQTFDKDYFDFEYEY